MVVGFARVVPIGRPLFVGMVLLNELRKGLGIVLSVQGLVKGGNVRRLDDGAVQIGILQGGPQGARVQDARGMRDGAAAAGLWLLWLLLGQFWRWCW